MFVENYLGKQPDYQEDHVILFENVRFNKGETKNSTALAKKYAALADIFIFNAFASSHRSHSSCDAVITQSKEAYAGPLFCHELTQLSAFSQDAKRPLVAIVGGAKVSTKLGLLEGLLKQADTVILGGGIANTFLKAKGVDVGSSLVENDFLDKAQGLMMRDTDNRLRIPSDFIVAPALRFARGTAARRGPNY